MNYKKEFDLITANYDLEKVAKFLKSHNYQKQRESLFKNEYFFQKNLCDDFNQEFEVSVLITDKKDKLVYELNSINSERIANGIKKYEKLLVETCQSILLKDDYKEEAWKKFYASIKNKKSAFTLAGFALDVIETL